MEIYGSPQERLLGRGELSQEDVQDCGRGEGGGGEESRLCWESAGGLHREPAGLVHHGGFGGPSTAWANFRTAEIPLCFKQASLNRDAERKSGPQTPWSLHASIHSKSYRAPKSTFCLLSSSMGCCPFQHPGHFNILLPQIAKPR